MTTPILVVCFNRPKLLQILFLRLEQIPRTDVFISVDRAYEGMANSENCKGVLALVKEYNKTSKHRVEIKFQEKNVGCNENTLSGMDFLLAHHSSGLLLEDDCEFVLPYIHFLNRNIDLIDSSKYMSISPMNKNWSSDLYYREFSDIYFRSSVLMGASLGLTFSKDSKSTFDVAIKSLSSKEMISQINKAMRSAPVNFLQQKVLGNLFEYKANKINQTWDKLNSEWSPQSETGWDSAWQLAAIFSGKKFLVPNFTLARESLFQIEGQWHPHSFSYPSWDNINEEFIIPDLENSKISSHPKIGEFSGVGVSKYPIRDYIKLIVKKSLIFKMASVLNAFLQRKLGSKP
jgi:hypothetical protein